MLNFLRNHPFAVECYFDSSLVITYAVPGRQLQNLVPECFSLDTFEDEWSFIALAIVKTRQLRPKGFPEFLGHNFILAGYRIFVTYRTSLGKRLRGLYILRTETDKQAMATLGNLFTHYNFEKTDIRFSNEANMIEVQSSQSNISIKAKMTGADITLPECSPFRNWQEARRFAGPLPFTLRYNRTSKEVLIVEGVRENWTPMPVEIVRSDVGFLNSLHLGGAVLASAFVIENIPYYWKKGRKEKWQQF